MVDGGGGSGGPFVARVGDAMTPLLEALQAASKVGFDAPVCDKCEGRGRYYCCPEHPCDWCDATGLDASDPEKLIGRAMMWLADRNSVTLYGSPVVLKPSVFLGHQYTPDHEEDHDRTETGIATALLRLVARVGGAK